MKSMQADRMSLARELIRPAAVLALSSGLMMAATFVGKAVLARVISVEEYGGFGLLLDRVAAARAGCDLGVAQAVGRGSPPARTGPGRTPAPPGANFSLASF